MKFLSASRPPPWSTSQSWGGWKKLGVFLLCWLSQLLMLATVDGGINSAATGKRGWRGLQKAHRVSMRCKWAFGAACRAPPRMPLNDHYAQVRMNTEHWVPPHHHLPLFSMVVLSALFFSYFPHSPFPSAFIKITRFLVDVVSLSSEFFAPHRRWMYSTFQDTICLISELISFIPACSKARTHFPDLSLSRNFEMCCLALQNRQRKWLRFTSSQYCWPTPHHVDSYETYWITNEKSSKMWISLIPYHSNLSLTWVLDDFG